jgi:ubiquinone/menaquinone biosynthesis C-methylase UbiE
MTSPSQRSPDTPSWDGQLSDIWLSRLDEREAPLAPILDALFEHAELQPGMTVLDVGCGAGPSTFEAARRVAPAGRVVGADISHAMIEAARQRADNQPNIDWLVADVQQHGFDPDTFDAVISRFGVMFFDDTLAAFRNLARATRPGGRLTMAVWPERDESDYFYQPLHTLAETLDRLGAEINMLPGTQGPFALGNRDELRNMLTAAGWAQVEIQQDQRKLYLGGPGASVVQAVDAALSFGPVAAGLEKLGPAVNAEARKDLIHHLQQWHDGNGVALTGGFLNVTARRPGAAPDDADQ